MVDEAHAVQRAGPRRTYHGGMSQASQELGDRVLGPGLTVRQRRVDAILILPGARAGAEHEPRGNCYDNAVAESYFSSLKKERVRRRIYLTREEAKSDLFDYIEIFYNRTQASQPPRECQPPTTSRWLLQAKSNCL